MNWKRYLALCAALGALVSLAGCTRGQVAEASNEAPAVEVEKAGDLSVVTVAKPERFQLVIAGTRGEVDQLTANGVVAPDVSRTVPVNALSSGRVVEIRARLGDDVQKGQLLLTLTSADMSQAFSDYKKFQADERLAKTQRDRAQLLFSHGALAQKDLDIAEETYSKAMVDTQTVAERIGILGGDPAHPSAVIEVHAPVSGTIIEQNATASAGIKSLDNSPNLFTLADLSQLWVICDVYENDLARVHVGDSAEIELNAYPNRRFPGKVGNISKLLDPATRTAKVRVEMDNARGLLRPNMFGMAHFSSRTSLRRVVVPAAAVLRLHDRDWAFVRAGDERFHRVEVQAGAVNPDGTEQILSGLKAGDQVVGDALLFDRESEQQ